MLYIVILAFTTWVVYSAIITLKRYFKTRISVMKNEINRSVFNFIMKLNNKLEKLNFYFKYSNEYDRNQILETISHYSIKLEPTLLDVKNLNQIQNWDLKMCSEVWRILDEGLHGTNILRSCKKRINRNEADNFDFNYIKNESLNLINVVSSKDLIGITCVYFGFIEDRINVLLNQMYNYALENQDEEMLLHAQFLKVRLTTYLPVYDNDDESIEILFSNSFNFDLFRITGKQYDDEDIGYLYFNFISKQIYRKYIWGQE